LGEHVLGAVCRIKGRHAARVGERAGGDVVVDRVGVGGDTHRPLKGHRHAQVDAAGALVGVAHQREDEGRPKLAVHDVLQRGVQHGGVVDGDVHVAGGAHVPPVTGGPDRVDLAGSLVLGQHVAVRRVG